MLRLLQARRNLERTITGRRAPRRRVVPRAVWPVGVDLAYRSTILTLVRAVQGQVERDLFPTWRAMAEEARRRDAVPEDVAAVKLSLLRGPFQGDNLRRLLRPVAQRVSDWQKAQLGRQLRSAVGVEVPLGDPGLAKRITLFTEENVGLIQSIAEESLGQVQRTVLKGLADGARWEDLADTIEDRFGVAESRAALIARDQVGKLYGTLSEVRQKDLGITRYRWRTSLDEKVRPEHAAREGKIYSWDDPPEDGHPGQPINCRCTAEPDVSGLLDSLE